MNADITQISFEWNGDDEVEDSFSDSNSTYDTVYQANTVYQADTVYQAYNSQNSHTELTNTLKRRHEIFGDREYADYIAEPKPNCFRLHWKKIITASVIFASIITIPTVVKLVNDSDSNPEVQPNTEITSTSEIISTSDIISTTEITSTAETILTTDMISTTETVPLSNNKTTTVTDSNQDTTSTTTSSDDLLQWGIWSECSQSCGNGQKSRKAICVESMDCISDEETSICNLRGCESLTSSWRKTEMNSC